MMLRFCSFLAACLISINAYAYKKHVFEVTGVSHYDEKARYVDAPIIGLSTKTGHEFQMVCDKKGIDMAWSVNLYGDSPVKRVEVDHGRQTFKVDSGCENAVKAIKAQLDKNPTMQITIDDKGLTIEPNGKALLADTAASYLMSQDDTYGPNASPEKMKEFKDKPLDDFVCHGG